MEKWVREREAHRANVANVLEKRQLYRRKDWRRFIAAIANVNTLSRLLFNGILFDKMMS